MENAGMARREFNTIRQFDRDPIDGPARVFGNQRLRVFCSLFQPRQRARISDIAETVAAAVEPVRSRSKPNEAPASTINSRWRHDQAYCGPCRMANGKAAISAAGAVARMVAVPDGAMDLAGRRLHMDLL